MNPIFCKHLRTKKIYIGSTPEEVFNEPEDANNPSTCHYWCNLTQTVVGVDDRVVHKNVCQAPRKCFEE